MYFVPESFVIESLSQAEVTQAVERVFSRLASGDARNFDVVREPLGYADAIFGFKSGFDAKSPALSVKAGGLWPGNKARGLPNHQSNIVLFDPETGGLLAIVEGTYLTSLRTAAASALSIRHLARKDSVTLGVLGAGGQARFQIRAALQVHPFERILIASRTPENAAALAKDLVQSGHRAEAVSTREMAERADVIITVSLSRSALIDAGWIRPGVHLACMGTDTKGKQEIDPAIIASSSVFGDVAQQAITIGECQHAYGAGLITSDQITSIGEVINSVHPGRTSPEEVTVFDSTGMGLQDLAAAELALANALSCGRAIDMKRIARDHVA